MEATGRLTQVCSFHGCAVCYYSDIIVCGLGFTGGCCLAVKERVSSVDQESNNYKYRYNGMRCGDPTLWKGKVYIKAFSFILLA